MPPPTFRSHRPIGCSMALVSNLLLLAICPRKLVFKSFCAYLHKSPAKASYAKQYTGVRAVQRISNFPSKFVKNCDAFALDLVTTQTCPYLRRRLRYNSSRLFLDRRQIRTAPMRYLRRHSDAFAQRGMRVNCFADVSCVCTHLDGQGNLPLPPIGNKAVPIYTR